MSNDPHATRNARPAPDTDGGSAAADFGLGLPPQETEKDAQGNPLPEPDADELPIPPAYPTA